MIVKRITALVSTALLAVGMFTALPALSDTPDDIDWGENLVTGGDFESPMAVGENPTGWHVIGQDANPVTVVAVGANGSSQSIRVPGRAQSGGSLTGLTWPFQHPMQKLKIEFSFAVPDMGNARTLEFWTRAPGVNDDASQITINYTSHSLVQVTNSGRKAIASDLLTSDPVDPAGMSWYRIRIVTDQDSGVVKFWLSDANGALPGEDTAPTASTGTWKNGTPFGSINMGFNHMYAPSYYFVDDVDVRGVPVPNTGPAAGSLDPFDGSSLVSNGGFEYDAPGADPAGWTRSPQYRYDTQLGVAGIGANGSDQSVHIQGMGAGSGDEGLAWLFDTPQTKIQAEFSLAYLGDGTSFEFFTGGHSHYSGARQAKLRVLDDRLQGLGFSWNTIATLTPSVDVDGDGDLVADTDQIHWNRIRVIATADGDYVAVWVAGTGGTFATAPTATYHVPMDDGRSIEGPIGWVAFGYHDVDAGSSYYVDDVTVGGIADDQPGASPDMARYQLWDGLEGPRTGVGAPVPEGMTISTIHAPGCEKRDKDEAECQTPADPVAGSAACLNDPPTYPACATDVLVHNHYQRFLHGAAIAEHNGVLWESWENGLTDENSPWAMQRGRYSTDGGQTWSAPVVIGPDPDWQPDPSDPEATGTTGPRARSHGAFIESGGHLYAFVTTFKPGDSTATFKADLHAELWVVDETDHTWSEVNSTVLDNVWPLEPPRKMADGNYIVAGVTKDYGPAVAISHGDDITEQWDTVVLPDARYSAKSSKFHYTEPTTWVDGSTITVVLRNQVVGQHYRAAGVAISHDYGRTWELGQHVQNDLGLIVKIPEMESNLPQAAANIFAGKLSTGQRYLIGNIANRHALNILVSRPGERVLSHSFLIQGDATDRPYLYPGGAKGPQFNQPYAIEVTASDGKNYLYVAYSDAKERAVFVTIPVSSLVVESPALATVTVPSGLQVEPGGSVEVPATATRVDGLPLDLSHAEITYHSDHPELVDFDGATMTVSPSAAGGQRISVWADVSFGRATVTSSPVMVSVQPPDVHPNNPYFDDLRWMITSGIATTYPDGTFRPFGRVSRGDVAAFLWRAGHQGQPDPTCDADHPRTFRDVPASSPACGVIEWAAEQGVMEGLSRHAFAARKPVTRGDLATALFRWVNPGVADPECTAPYRVFSDVAAHQDNCGAVEWMAARQLARGYPDGTFHPRELVTRQSVASYVRRAMSLNG